MKEKIYAQSLVLQQSRWKYNVNYMNAVIRVAIYSTIYHNTAENFWPFFRYCRYRKLFSIFEICCSKEKTYRQTCFLWTFWFQIITTKSTKIFFKMYILWSISIIIGKPVKIWAYNISQVFLIVESFFDSFIMDNIPKSIEKIAKVRDLLTFFQKYTGKFYLFFFFFSNFPLNSYWKKMIH